MTDQPKEPTDAQIDAMLTLRPNDADPDEYITLVRVPRTAILELDS
jgi:hypothetical protein